MQKLTFKGWRLHGRRFRQSLGIRGASWTEEVPRERRPPRRDMARESKSSARSDVYRGQKL